MSNKAKTGVPGLPLNLYRGKDSKTTDMFKPILKSKEETKQLVRSSIGFSNNKNSISPRVSHLAPKQFIEKQGALTSRVKVADDNDCDMPKQML